MAPPTVEEIYKCFEILDSAGSSIAKHEAQFLLILSAVKGEAKEKQLACQFITRFFRHFPELSEQALDAQLDLCEDESVNIRRHAIKELPNFAKANADNVSRISDILAQLLGQTSDKIEQNVVQSAMLQVLKLDPEGALKGLFQQIIESENELVREGTIRFLGNKIISMNEILQQPGIEDLIIEKVKQALSDVTCDEFLAFIKILSSLRSMQLLKGRIQLVEIIAQQADLKSTLNPNNVDAVLKVFHCTRQAVPFFSKNVHSTQFLKYYLENVIPNASTMCSISTDKPIPSKLEIFKLLTDLVVFCDNVDDSHLHLLHNCLMDHIPSPPEGDQEKISIEDHPNFELSNVECILYSFHSLAKKSPHFLSQDESRLNELRKRLQYFALDLQIYIKKLKENLGSKSREELRKSVEENKTKLIALKVTTNIQTVIKDLLHNPPQYNANVVLSWKSAKTPTPTEQKRSLPVATSIAKKPREIYQPPMARTNHGSAKAVSDRGTGRGKGKGIVF